ncbi:MAG: DUF1127 domain-containing protein [Actinomycetota bacterium]
MQFLHVGLAKTSIVQSQQCHMFSLKKDARKPDPTPSLQYDQENTMAYASDIRISAASENFAVAAFRRAISSVTQYLSYRSTVKQLSALSTRELEDLGLNRAMIRSAAYNAVYAA